MYTHILVVADGSGTSKLALNEAIKLASDQRAAIRLAYVADLIPTYMDLEIPNRVVQYQKALREIGHKAIELIAPAIMDRQMGMFIRNTHFHPNALASHSQRL